MFKERLRKISTKAFYIVFAIVVSIVLWMYVEITENEAQTREIAVEIDFRNEDIINDRGLLVSRIVTENLSITFEGSRSDISRLIASGVSVEVNLANVQSAGPLALDYEIVYPQSVNANAITIRGRSASRVTLVIDRLLERQIDVEVNYRGGTSSDDLVALPAEFDPQVITVRGPEEIISQISHAYVPIMRENLSATITEDFSFILLDENGEELNLDLHGSVILSQESIRVTIPIRLMKVVPLFVELSHGLTTSSANTTVSVTPEFITISGDPEVIRDINQFMLGTIDMLSFGLSATRSYPIIIPNHITNVSGENEAMVLVEVLGEDIAFRSVSNIQVINIPAGFRAEIITQSIDVRIRGLDSELALVTHMNLRVVADLTDVGRGASSVLAKAFISGIEADVEPVGEYRITVTLFAD